MFDLADSLDDISDFEEELKSAESDSVREISSSNGTYDDSIDDSDYGEGTSATKARERNLWRSQPSIPVNPVQRRRSGSNKNTNKKANCGGNQNRKTTQMLNNPLGDVMMKLEGRPGENVPCVGILYQSGCLNMT